MSSVAEPAASVLRYGFAIWLLAISPVFGGDKGNETQLASKLLMVGFFWCVFFKLTIYCLTQKLFVFFVLLFKRRMSYLLIFAFINFLATLKLLITIYTSFIHTERSTPTK